MTDDDTRLDARVRRALTTLPAPDDHDTRVALQAVLERSTAHAGRPTGRWAAPMAAAAAVVVVAVTTAVVALVTEDREPPSPTQPPDSPSGTWQRQVPGPATDQWAGTWTMTLTPDGVLVLSGPAGAPPGEGASYSTDQRRVRVDAFANNACADLPVGTYEWRTSDSVLTLVLVDDPCEPRSDLFTGTWRRAP